MAGGREFFTFDISSSDCDRLISNLNMREVTEGDLTHEKEFGLIKEKAYLGIFPAEKIYIISKFEGMVYKMLITNKDKTKVYFVNYRT